MEKNSQNQNPNSQQQEQVKRHELEPEQKKRKLIVYAISIFALTLLAALFIVLLVVTQHEKATGGIISIAVIYALGILTATVLLRFKLQKTSTRTTFFTTKNITRTAVFSALSIILYYFIKVPAPTIFPSFLDFQFSELPALLAGYMMGPISGSIVIVVKFLVKLPATGTSGVGELVDLILGLSFVIPASLIYRKHHSIKAALISLTIGSLSCVAAAALANRFIAIPAYLSLMFDGNWAPLLGMMNAIFDGKVTEQNFYRYYIFLSIIPFNLIRCLITAVLTFLTYKSLKRLFDRIVR